MPRKKVNKATDIEELFDQFKRRTQYNSDLERYQDFRELFLGSEIGKRVFNEILGMGYMANDTTKFNTHGVDPNATLISTGERKLALSIHKLVMVAPSAPPPPTQKTRR
tara:strand:- start:127 stop:453 length:327 start_codon:yes stop_codon:yes gene_type:complete